MKSFRDDCILIENSLALWVGGDLEAELRDRIDLHLSQCERCDAQARSLDASREALISGLCVDADRAPDLWPGLQSVLRSEGRFAPGREIAVAPQVTHSLRALPAAHAPVPFAKGRGLRVAGRFGIAAAAAVMVGFMLGRLGSERPIETNDAPPIVRVTPPESSSPGPSTTPVVQPKLAVPVSDGARLHRLAPGEAPLAETAQNFATEWYFPSSQSGNANVGSPASLHSVQPRW
jgi:hypothetical protein